MKSDSQEPFVSLIWRKRLAYGLVVLLVLTGLSLFLVTAIRGARESARWCSCNSNLKQMGLGMLNYHAAYGAFPPAYTVDTSGKRLHSWRTLILPFMERKEIYNRLRLDEPWNSPHNLAVFKEVDASGYQCPSCYKDHEGCYTNYALVIGPNCVSDGPTSCKLDDLANGSSNTILVVETTAPIRWYEPKDIDIRTLDGEASEDEPIIGSCHLRTFQALFCDGSADGIDKNIDKSILRAAIEGKVKSEEASKITED